MLEWLCFFRILENWSCRVTASCSRTWRLANWISLMHQMSRKQNGWFVPEDTASNCWWITAIHRDTMASGNRYDARISVIAVKNCMEWKAAHVCLCLFFIYVCNFAPDCPRNLEIDPTNQCPKNVTATACLLCTFVKGDWVQSLMLLLAVTQHSSIDDAAYCGLLCVHVHVLYQ